jgi:hypothetical protein
MSISIEFVEKKIIAEKVDKDRKTSPSTLDKIFQEEVVQKVDNPPTLDMREIRNQIAKNMLEAAQIALHTKFTGSSNSIMTIQEALTTLKDLKATIDSSEDPVPLLYWTSQLVEIVGICSEIVDLLLQKPEEITHEKIQSIREKLSLALTFFKENETAILTPSCPSSHDSLDSSLVPFLKKTPIIIDFLQCLAYQIKTQSKGMQVFEDIGTHATSYWLHKNNEPLIDNKKSSSVSAKTFADHVEEAFKNMPADHWDSPLNWLVWAFKNIAEAFYALIDNLIPGCHVFYNSYDRGNADMCLGDFVVAEQNIRTNVGPGPMNDPSLTDAAISQASKSNVLYGIHFLENHHKRGEATRLCRMRDLDKKHTSDLDKNRLPNVLVMGTPLDGKIAKGRKNFANIQSVKKFHEELSKELTGNQLIGKRKIPPNVKHYEGFAIDENLLSEQDFKDVIDASEAAFTAAFTAALPQENLNPYKDKTQNKRLCSALLAGFTGFLTLKILMKLGNKLKDFKDLNQNELVKDVSAVLERECKQCADRGPVINAIIIAFTKMIENGKLQVTDEKQLMGLLIGRSMIAGPERKMVKGRRETFIDLFKIIGNNEQAFIQKLQEFVGKRQGQPSPIQFIASNSLRNGDD